MSTALLTAVCNLPASARAFSSNKVSGLRVPNSLRTTTKTNSALQVSATLTEQLSSRRQILQAASLAPLFPLLPSAAQAKGKAAFAPVKDLYDAYSFLYPYGWQEVTVTGQDVVYKDVIEPLESVSVSLTPTDKTDVTEFGAPDEVAFALADKVLTSPNQEVKVLNVKPKAINGRNYIEFEFAAKSANYIRHALAVVTVGNGKFYTLTTGANERRWNKVAQQLAQVVDSFEVTDRY